MANIFLHVYEKLYVQQSIDNSNIGNLNILGYSFRYQDDLIIFESNYVNDNILSNIYPTEMIIKNTNKSITEVSYLDLSISITNNQYYYKSYDKRKYFDFKVINYPNLKGNVPINPSYRVFISQLIRFSSINQHISDFTSDIKSLINKLRLLGYSSTRLQFFFSYLLNTFWNRYIKEELCD